MILFTEFNAFYFKYALLLGTVQTLLCLPAICAAVSRGHWFRRAMIGVGFLVLLMPSRTFEPIVLVMVYSLAVAFSVALSRYVAAWRRRAIGGQRGLPPIRFSLRDLLLFTLVVAVLTAIASYSLGHFYNFTWLGMLQIVLHGLGLAAISLSTAWLVLGRGWLWLRMVVVLIALGVSMLVLSFCNIWLHPYLRDVTINFPKWYISFCILTAITELLLLLMCFVLLRLSDLFNRTRENDAATLRWRKLRLTARIVSFLIIFAMLVPCGFLYWQLSIPLPIVDQGLPNPNGYLALSELGGEYESINIPSYSYHDPPSVFIAFTKKHRTNLRQVREMLQLPCRVPFTYKLGEDDWYFRVQNMRALANALSSAAEGMRINGESDGAIDYLLDCLLLGKKVTHGGRSLDYSVGNAIERVGRTPLRKMHDRFTVEQCQRVIATLLELENEREPLADIVQRDKAMERYTYGWQIDFHHAVDTMIGDKDEVDYVNRSLRYSVKWRDALSRLLMTELAIRAYRLEHSALPNRLDELVPDYLPTVPRDPYVEGDDPDIYPYVEGDKPLIYRLTDDGYLLYSVGTNGRDDGGEKSSHRQLLQRKGDMFFDSPDLPYNNNQQKPTADD